MNKTLILLLFFIACPIVVMAQPLLVELVNQNEPLDPGKVHTLVFKIYHQNNHPVILTPHVLLPENWPMTSSLTDIQLSGNEEKIYLMQIHVPSNASTGKHELRLVLQNQKKKRTEYEFEILVNKLRKISVNSVSSTAYVKAGETIHSIFIVKNEGNQSEIFSLESSQNAAIEGETTLSLAAGEAREVHIHQPTNVNYPRPSQQSIKLTAYNVMDSLPGVYAYNRTEVIPVITQNEDVFYRFPAKASVSYLGRERAGEFQDSYQGEIYGKGSLDEHNVHQLEFRAFGPNQFELSTFYQYEEYFANYQTDNFFVHFGDKVFSSSFLTEYARYGRGAEVRKSIRQWEVGGFYNNPRFYKDIEEEINLYTQYNFNKKNHLRYGYLNKQMENQNENYHLHFLTGETTLFKKIQLKGEYSQSFSESTQGYAWYLQASAHLKKVTANVSYIDASPDFGGYYKNTSFFNSHINYRISPQLTLHANFQQDARRSEERR